MDGLVLVLAVILNPRAKKRARNAERVEIPHGRDGDSGGNDGSVMTTVVPAVQQDKENDPASSRTVP